MRYLLLLSTLSISLSSCYVEVTGNHHHSDNHSDYSSDYFTDLHISESISYSDALLISGYAMQLYSLSNQPHQMAYLANSNNLLNDSVLKKSLIDGDMLGIEHQDISDISQVNPCDYGQLDITDYQTRIYDNYNLNGDNYDEFDASFSLHTSPVCEYRKYDLNASDANMYLDGILNYDIYFNNLSINSNISHTQEFIASISGSWSVENNSLGYWNINNFSSDSSYRRFYDNAVSTDFRSQIQVHDHKRQINAQFEIQSDQSLLTELGIIHPYSGSISIYDSATRSEITLRLYDESIDIFVNGRSFYSFVSWDEVLNSQSYFGLL